MFNKRLSVVSIFFYILAGLLLIFAVWSAVNSFKYISNLVNMGQVIVKDSLFDIVNFHINSFGQYIVYAALLFGIGWIVDIFADVEIESYEFTDEELEALNDLLEDELEEEEEEEEEETEEETKIE